MTIDLPTFDDAAESSVDDPLNEYTEPEAEDHSPGGMREKLSSQAARIKELEAQVNVGEGQLRAETMHHAYDALKLDPNHGVGRAVATLYDGEPEGLAEFVRSEFGYQARPDQHPMAAQIALGWAQLDQVGNVSGSVRQTTRAERLATAQAAGDFQTEGAILAAQAQEAMDRMHGRSR